MTVPRRLVPDRTHAVTRRTAGRCFFLTPTPAVRQIVLYVLGLAQERYPRVSVHAAMVESNHIHMLVTDRAEPSEPSELPEFFGLQHSLVARALNTLLGRGENLWRTGSYDNAEVHGQTSLERQLVYLWTNPVKDGLVARPEDWPGVKFLPEDFGRTITVERPEGAFFGGRRPAHVLEAAQHAHAKDGALGARWSELAREERETLRAERRRRDDVARGRGARRRKTLEIDRRRRKAKERAPRPPRSRCALPDRVTVRIDPPPGYAHLPVAEVRAHFRRLLDAELATIHAERAEAGRTRFLGAKAVVERDPYESAGDTFPAFARNPRIACTGRVPRAEALRALQAWRREVAEKREAWREGHREVVFPAGVYGMWRFHGARVAGAAPRAAESATGPPRGAEAPRAPPAGVPRG